MIAHVLLPITTSIHGPAVGIYIHIYVTQLHAYIYTYSSSFNAPYISSNYCFVFVFVKSNLHRSHIYISLRWGLRNKYKTSIHDWYFSYNQKHTNKNDCGFYSSLSFYMNRCTPSASWWPSTSCNLSTSRRQWIDHCVFVFLYTKTVHISIISLINWIGTTWSQIEDHFNHNLCFWHGNHMIQTKCLNHSINK